MDRTMLATTLMMLLGASTISAAHSNEQRLPMTGRPSRKCSIEPIGFSMPKIERTSMRSGNLSGILHLLSLSRKPPQLRKETGLVSGGTKSWFNICIDVIFGGPFRIDPDYTKVHAVLFTRDVAETYVPVKITVGYAGQQAVPKPSSCS